MPRAVVVIRQYQAVLYACSILYGSIQGEQRNVCLSVCLSMSACYSNTSHELNKTLLNVRACIASGRILLK